MPDYSKGKIYKIECNTTGEVYYGSTTSKLSDRMRKHRCYDKAKRDCISKQIIKRNNYQAEVVEEYPCNSKEELEKREGFYILNNECINMKIVGRTEEERKKDYNERKKKWRNENKEIVAERLHNWYTRNREKVIERSANNAIKNSEKIKAYKKEWFQNVEKPRRRQKKERELMMKEDKVISSHTDTPPDRL